MKYNISMVDDSYEIEIEGEEDNSDEIYHCILDSAKVEVELKEKGQILVTVHCKIFGKDYEFREGLYRKEWGYEDDDEEDIAETYESVALLNYTVWAIN